MTANFFYRRNDGPFVFAYVWGDNTMWYVGTDGISLNEGCGGLWSWLPVLTWYWRHRFLYFSIRTRGGGRYRWNTEWVA